jgi:hypothetical protein
MTPQSPFPHVVAPLPVGAGGPAPEDYAFAAAGEWREDPACRAVLFSRNIGAHLEGVLAREAQALAARGALLAVVGTVAWATETRMLAALAHAAAGGVCLVVNKEEWLSAEPYAALQPLALDHLFGSASMLPPAYTATPSPCIAAWCAGAVNSQNKPSWPRMHRKLLVLCQRRAPTAAEAAPPLEPYAVWTGSYNLSGASRRSVESAALLFSTALADFEYHQFLCVLAHAEPVGAHALTSVPALHSGP